MLYGRDPELTIVDELLAGTRAERSGVLVFRGDAGTESAVQVVGEELRCRSVT